MATTGSQENKTAVTLWLFVDIIAAKVEIIWNNEKRKFIDMNINCSQFPVMTINNNSKSIDLSMAHFTSGKFQNIINAVIKYYKSSKTFYYLQLNILNFYLYPSKSLAHKELQQFKLEGQTH